MTVSALVMWSRGFVRLRRSLRGETPCEQRHSSACASRLNSLPDSAPSFPDWNMRFNALLLDHPGRHGASAAGGVTDEVPRLCAEALLHRIDRHLCRLNLQRSVCRRRFNVNVNDDPSIKVDQAIRRVRILRRSAWCRGPMRGRVGEGHIPSRRRIVIVCGHRVALLKTLQILANSSAGLFPLWRLMSAEPAIGKAEVDLFAQPTL